MINESHRGTIGRAVFREVLVRIDACLESRVVNMENRFLTSRPCSEDEKIWSTPTIAGGKISCLSNELELSNRYDHDYLM